MDIVLDKNKVNYEQLLAAFPTPYLVFRVKWPKLIIVACSDSYLAVTKAARDFIMHKDVFDAFPPLPGVEGKKTQRDFITSFERVLQDKISDVMGVQRYDVPKDNNPNEFDEKYWTVINSPVLDTSGEVKYIIQRVEDVTEYILLKKRLLDSEQENSSTWSKVEAEIMRTTHEVKEANRDIKEYNENLIDLNAKLKELDKLKTEFFSNVSHEFRTPLTLMLGPLEDLLANLPQNTEMFEKVGIAHRNALRLLKLVNSLLDFSRFEAGRAKAVFHPVNISTVTKEVASHFDSAASKSAIRLEINCPPMPQMIYLDLDAYEKILLNIISNAFKHTFEGSISINLNWLGNGVELTVSDTGIGIPADHIEHIFKRFHRVPNAKSRTHEGSGIGLSLVQELVKLHQGEIRVSSILNQGTTLTLFFLAGNQHLPQEQIGSRDPASNPNLVQPFFQEVMQWLEASASNANPINTQESGKPSILLADDNHDMRNYIYHLLNPHYHVIIATNGQDALEQARIHHPDLILSDVMMPCMTGVELAQHIRKDPKLKLVPLILLSARAGSEAKVEGLQTGADDYLVKPFTAQELLIKIKTNLELQTMRHEAQSQMAKAAQLKDQFISNMSHELRTPLNAIIGYSEMIGKGMVDSEETKLEFVENIRAAGRHLLLLINDMLDLSKIEAGKFKLNIKAIDVKLFVADLKSMLNELAAKNNVSLHFDISDDVTSMMADPVRLKQIMINLLNNAIKFNKENGSVAVNLTKNQDNTQVCCQISDTGIGIPKDKINDLFTEFFQVDSSNSRMYEGTGLGLALTKKLVNLHGGEISVQSEEGKGSTFIFTLPLGLN